MKVKKWIGQQYSPLKAWKVKPGECSPRAVKSWFGIVRPIPQNLGYTLGTQTADNFRRHFYCVQVVRTLTIEQDFATIPGRYWTASAAHSILRPTRSGESLARSFAPNNEHFCARYCWPSGTRAERFASVSTHLDVTPTFLAFLNHNYDMPIPKYSSWVSAQRYVR